MYKEEKKLKCQKKKDTTKPEWPEQMLKDCTLKF